VPHTLCPGSIFQPLLLHTAIHAAVSIIQNVNQFSCAMPAARSMRQIHQRCTMRDGDPPSGTSSELGNLHGCTSAVITIVFKIIQSARLLGSFGASPSNSGVASRGMHTWRAKYISEGHYHNFGSRSIRDIRMRVEIERISANIILALFNKRNNYMYWILNRENEIIAR